MIHKKSVKYRPTKRGTSLYAEFNFNSDVEDEHDTKENIQKRFGYGARKEYLKQVEGLNLGSPNYSNGDDKDLGRFLSFPTLNPKTLKLSIKVTTEQKEVPKEDMFNLDNFNMFMSRGRYPWNKKPETK